VILFIKNSTINKLAPSFITVTVNDYKYINSNREILNINSNKILKNIGSSKYLNIELVLLTN